MKISIQQSQDRDVVGLFNALTHRRHEILWWDPDKQDLKEFRPDVAIFTDSSKLGYRVFGSTAKAVNLFVKCDAPEECKAEKRFKFETMPDLADTVLFPPAYFHKNLAVDVFFLSLYPLENESQVQCLNVIDPLMYGFTWRAAGNVPLPHVSYIGRVQTPEESSKLCKSAKVCIDFGFKQALDLLKLGCQVITDTPNNLQVPVFTPSTINQVIKEAIAQPKPIINRYEEKILSYSQFCGHLEQLIGVAL